MPRLRAPTLEKIAVFLAACTLALWLAALPALAAVGKGEDNPRMSASASPYLRSHAHDLVRWYAWGDEAFARARELKRPIMVSFGYTACHWCHVMQEKHFNDAGIAKQINEQYVPVLVDRERRSTLDETYLLVTEVVTQRSGWPNTVFLTPELKPFYGTAYVPPDVFGDLLGAVTKEWVSNREPIVAEAERIATILNGYLNRREEAKAITPEALAEATKTIVASFDPFAGGIGQAPKFFRPTVLTFLLHQYQRTGDKAALRAVQLTLRSIQSGGIHDHIEGGFHRYAIDPGWRVPHFEKMLYDQAQLAEIFTLAHSQTGNPLYGQTARKTLDYILNDLTAPLGGFYSTRDADSEGEEGTYYVWTPQQLEAALGKADAEYAINTFGQIADGDFAGKIILNTDDVRGQTIPRLIKVMGRLGEARKSRNKPIRDEKILVSWNGMTIASLAHAGHVLGEPRYIEAATKAADFIWTNMRRPDGRLQRSYFAGKAEIEAELNDYAQLARGLINLYDATGERQWLDRAMKLASTITEVFEDTEQGDYFATPDVAGFSRAKSRGDVDQASSNGAVLDVLVRLSNRSIDPQYKRKSEKAMAALSGVALASPENGGSVLAASDRFLRGEMGAVQYAGNGVVRAVSVRLPEKRRITVRLDIAEGWHINADQPLEAHLIPTKLDLLVDGKSADAVISYPAPEIKKLTFNEKPMALLERKVELSAHLDSLPATGVKLVIEVQVCSDDLCLLPETLSLQPVTSGSQ